MKEPNESVSFFIGINMRKSILLVAAAVQFSGCGPQILLNRATGESVICKLEGFPPGYNRRTCIEDHEAKGWVQATEQQLTINQENINKYDRQRESVKACGDNMKKDPSLQVIAGKIALGGSAAQSFSHLTNTSKPTETEKKAISIYADNLKKCFTEQDKLNINYPPPILAVNHSSFSAVQNLLASLYNGNLTYGDFAKIRKDIANNHETALAQIDHELRKNAAETNARAQEIAAQNAIAQSQASQAVSSSMIAGAAMANAFKPTISPVQSNNVNCTTTALGSSLRTSCY